MPNGGSDCCGTCWFNKANEGQPGYNSETESHNYCIIRNLDIPNAFWTYCANHPHHNANKCDVPIGPVYICDDYPYTRRVWVQAPDNEEIRERLLVLLDAIEEKPKVGYPSETQLDTEIVKQLGMLGEIRALPKLLKILDFDPFCEPETENVFRVSRVPLINLVLEAITNISGDEHLVQIEKFVKIGLEKLEENYIPKEDKYAPLRYHAIRALSNCRSKQAIYLLKQACNDPHPEIVTFAKEILSKKI